MEKRTLREGFDRGLLIPPGQLERDGDGLLGNKTRNSGLKLQHRKLRLEIRRKFL